MKLSTYGGKQGNGRTRDISLLRATRYSAPVWGGPFSRRPLSWSQSLPCPSLAKLTWSNRERSRERAWARWQPGSHGRVDPEALPQASSAVCSVLNAHITGKFRVTAKQEPYYPRLSTMRELTACVPRPPAHRPPIHGSPCVPRDQPPIRGSTVPLLPCQILQIRRLVYPAIFCKRDASSGVANRSFAGYLFSSRCSIMRFWVGLLLGLFIGVSATAAYFEFWDSGADEIASQVDDP